MLSRMIAICMAVLLMAGATARAAQSDYAQDVSTRSDPSPRDLVTGSSVNQFSSGETNSEVDTYINQDEQINLQDDSGVVKVLRTNQKANINKFVSALIPLRNANPRELRGLARTICRKEGGDADVLQDKVTKEYYLAVVCPTFQLPYLRQTFQALDHDWVTEVSDGAWFVYYQGQYRDVRNMMDILGVYGSPDHVWDFDDPNNAVVFSDQPNVEPLWKLGTQAVDIPPSEVLLDVAVYEVDTQNDLQLGFDFASWKNGPGRDLFEAVLWDFNGDDPLGLFPGDAPADVADWGRFASYNFLITSAYIDFLQTKGRAHLLNKAMISAKSGTVAEVAALDQVAAFRSDVSSSPDELDLDAPLRLGALYRYFAGLGQTSFTIDQLTSLPSDAIIAEIDAFLGFVLDVDSGARAGVADELTEAGADGTITFDELDDVLVSQEITLQVFRERTLQYLKSGHAGVLLSILPVVGLESAEMSVALDVSDLVGHSPSGAPIIDHRYVASTVEVADGQPMALGGIKRQVEVRGGSGVPFLRDIPYLGYAFGRETTVKREKELVVLMIPRFRLCPTRETAPPEELETALRLAAGEDVLEVPENAFGFDQWLLDSGM